MKASHAVVEGEVVLPSAPHVCHVWYFQLAHLLSVVPYR